MVKRAGWSAAALAHLLAIAVATLWGAPVLGAETVHLFLKVNGTPVAGESTQVSLDRQDSIECLSFSQAASLPTDAATTMATGRRQYDPITIRKRVDRSSPLLIPALARNQVAEGTFRFYRPNPSGDGTTQQFFTVEFRKGRIVHYRLIVPDVLDPSSAPLPAMEEVRIVFQTITWKYEPLGVAFEDTLNPIREAEPLVQGRSTTEGKE
jgi:type VI secretion system secreted protein Hcp